MESAKAGVIFMRMKTARFKTITIGAAAFFYFIWLLGQHVNFAHPLPLVAEAIINSAVITLLGLFLTKKITLNSKMDCLIFISFISYLFILHQTVTFISIHYYVVMEYIGDFHILYDRINLIPFHTILGTIFTPHQAKVEYIQLIGNMFLLAPFSFSLLALRITKTAKKTLIVLLFVSAGIEIFQFIESFINSSFKFGEGRATDIDDFLLNTISAVVGIVLFFTYDFVKKNANERPRVNSTTANGN